MTEDTEKTDIKLLYLAFFIIMFLAVLRNLSINQTIDIIAVSMIIIIAIGNISYLYRKSKKTKT